MRAALAMLEGKAASAGRYEPRRGCSIHLGHEIRFCLSSCHRSKSFLQQSKNFPLVLDDRGQADLILEDGCLVLFDGLLIGLDFALIGEDRLLVPENALLICDNVAL